MSEAGQTLYLFVWHVGGGGWQHETFALMGDAFAAHAAHTKAGFLCGPITRVFLRYPSLPSSAPEGGDDGR